MNLSSEDSMKIKPFQGNDLLSFTYFFSKGRPTCSCALGFTGPNCGKTVCEDFCQNGGTCSVTAGNQPRCHCQPEHTGDRCQYCKLAQHPTAGWQWALVFTWSNFLIALSSCSLSQIHPPSVFSGSLPLSPQLQQLLALFLILFLF